MKKSTLFLLCLGGGVLFGGLFFALFGMEAGYNWTLAWLSAVGGIGFAVAFYAIWLIVQKFSKPVTFEDIKAQKRLQDDEGNFGAYEARFHGRISVGKGLKAAVCETYFYLLPDELRISYSYFRKIYFVEVAYSQLNAEVDEEGFFRFEWENGICWGRLYDASASSFRDCLAKKGVSFHMEEPFSEI